MLAPRSPPLYAREGGARRGADEQEQELQELQEQQEQQEQDPDRVLVGVRVRPLLDAERAKSARESWAWDAQQIESREIDLRELSEAEIAKLPDGRKTKFAFDRVFAPDEQTVDVYADQVAGLVERVVEGYNATILAYGQTTSGKTHTITGSEEEKGILQLALEDLFDLVHKDGFDKAYRFSLHVSYCEIYQEVVRDLLDPAKHHLSIADDPRRGPVVRGLTEVTVASAQDALDLVAKGQESRKVGVTQISSSSSRSHSLFQVRVESRPRLDETADDPDAVAAAAAAAAGASPNSPPAAASASDALRQWMDSYEKPLATSTLSVIDLAGSERVSKTRASGERLKEAGFINKSLAALGNVISAINAGATHIPFRSSKLTRLLTSALGGNSYTAMICCVSPSILHHDESRSTLQFANRASKVKTHAKLNQVETGDKIIQAFRTQVGTLQRELALNVSEKQSLQEKVEALERKLQSSLAKSLQTPRFQRRKALIPQTAVRPRRAHALAAIPDAPFTVARVQQQQPEKAHRQLGRGDLAQHTVRFQTAFEDDAFVGANDTLALRSVDFDALEHELTQRDRQVAAAKAHLLGAQEKLQQFLLDPSAAAALAITADGVDAQQQEAKEDELADLRAQLQEAIARENGLQERSDDQRDQDAARIHALERQLETAEETATEAVENARKLDQARRQIEEARTRIAVLEKQLAASDEARPEQDNMLAELKSELADQRRQATASAARASALERKLQDKESSMERQEASARALLEPAFAAVRQLAAGGPRDPNTEDDDDEQHRGDFVDSGSRSLESALRALGTGVEKAAQAVEARCQRELREKDNEVLRLKQALEDAEFAAHEANAHSESLQASAASERDSLEAAQAREVDELRKQIRNLEGRITEQDALQTRLAGLHEELGGLRDAVESAETEKARLREEADEAIAHADRVRELEDALEARNSQLVDLEAERSALKDRVSELVGAVEEKERRIVDMGQAGNDRQQLVEKELDELQARLRAREEQLGVLQAAEASLQARLDASEKRGADLEASKQNFAVRVQELEEEAKTLGAAKESLQDRVDEIDGTAQALEDQLRNLEDEKVALEEQHQALINAKAQLESRLEELEGDSKELEETRKDLETSIQELEGRLGDQARELETVEEKNHALANRVRELEDASEELERAESRLNEKQGELDAAISARKTLENSSAEIRAAKDELARRTGELQNRVDELAALVGTKDATNLELLERHEKASEAADARIVELCRELEEAQKACRAVEKERDELAGKCKGLEAASTELDAVSGELARLREGSVETERARQSAAESLAAMEKDLAAAKQRADDASALAASRASEVSASLADAEQARAALRKAESELTQVKEATSASAAAGEMARSEKQRFETRALRARIQALEADLEGAARHGRERSRKAEKRAERLARDYASVSEALDEARAALGRLRNEKERQRRALARSRRQVSLGIFLAMVHRCASRSHRSSIDRVARAQQAALKRFEVRLEAAQAQVERHAAERKKLTGLLQRGEHGDAGVSQLRDALAQLQNALLARDKEIVKLKASHVRAETTRDGAEDRVDELAQELQRARDEQSAALATCRRLEAALRKAKAEGLDDAKVARQEADVASLAICRALDRLEGLGAASPHLGAVELAERLDRATRGSNEASTSMQRSASLEVSHEQLERRVSELEAENQTLRVQTRQSAAAIASSAARSAIRKPSETSATSGTVVQRLETKLDKLERLLQEKDAQLNDFQQETAEVSKLLAEREREVSTAQRSALMAREAEAGARANMARLQSRVQALEAEVVERRPVSRELTEARLQLERAQEDCKALAQENRVLKEELRASEDLAQEGLACLQEESKATNADPPMDLSMVPSETGDRPDTSFAGRTAKSPFLSFQTPIPVRRGDFRATPSTAVSRTSTSLIEELRKSASKQIDALRAGNNDLRLAFAEKDRQLTLVLSLMEESEADFRQLLDLLERFNHNSEDYADQLAQVKTHMERLLTWQNRKREQRRRARQKQLQVQE